MEPTPPVDLEDPFGHDLRAETKAQGAVYSDQDAYDQAFAQWVVDSPVPLGGPLTRVARDSTCPVCDQVSETAEGYAPGCYLAYAGRRWDCYELWGRNLSAAERRQMIEHESRAPRLLLTLPDGSGTALV